MAHKPVGAGISLSTTAVSSLTTSFTVQSNVLRVTAVSAGAFVAMVQIQPPQFLIITFQQEKVRP